MDVIVEKLEMLNTIVVEKCSSPCIGSPCDHGRCIPDLNGETYECQCDDGWIGEHCDIG